MVSGWASPEATLGVCFTFTALALIAYSLRMYTRVCIIRQPGWDDLCVSIAMAFTMVDAGAQVFKIKWGLTRHIKDLTPYEIINMEKSHWVAAWNYFFGLGFAKLSIVLQCLRIFGHIPTFRKWANVLLGILILFTLWSGFQSIFVCWPVAKFWDKEIPGRCLPRLDIWFFNSGFNIVTDFATAILPIPVVKSLQMPRREKMALMFVLALGGSVCIITIIRLYTLYALVHSKDPARDLTQGGIYSNLEAAAAILVSCLPTLKGLLTRYFPAIFASKSDSRGHGVSSPSIELTGTGMKSHTTVTVQSQGSIRRGSRPGWMARRFGPTGRMELDNESGEVVASMEHKGMQTDGHMYGGKDIEVVTTVEQIERRQDSGASGTTVVGSTEGEGRRGGNSEEHLVPVRPYERP